jgi:predicted transcriptional regulator
MESFIIDLKAKLIDAKNKNLISDTELARKIGISYPVLVDFFKERRKTSLHTLRKIKKYLESLDENNL